MADKNHVTMTDRELATRLGCTKDAAHQRIKRNIKNGKWKEVPPNFPGAPLRAEVPLSDLKPRSLKPGPQPKQRGGHEALVEKPTPPLQPAFDDRLLAMVSASLKEAQDEAKRLRAELDKAKKDNASEKAEAAAKIGRLRAELDAGRAEADKLRAQTHNLTARQVEIMYEARQHAAGLGEKLASAQSEAAGAFTREIALGASNDRLEAENERLLNEVEGLRRRGWFARLVNR